MSDEAKEPAYGPTFWRLNMSDQKFLIQLHWQNRANLYQTEFVAQGEFGNADSAHAWAREVIERRGAEMPDGWCPLLITQSDHRFVMQASKEKSINE